MKKVVALTLAALALSAAPAMAMPNPLEEADRRFQVNGKPMKPFHFTDEQREACVVAIAPAFLPPHPVWTPARALVQCAGGAYLHRPKGKRK